MQLPTLMSGILGESRDYDFGIVSHTFDNYPALSGTVVLSIVLLASWRFFRFTILPAFAADDEAPELPYAVPLLGHLLSFFGDANTLITQARHHFGDTREPFALTVAGMKTYVITKAEDVGQVYRNTQTLSYEIFVQSMMRILGNSDSAIKAMFTPLPKDKAGFPNPQGKALGILFRQMHIHQLFPGENLTFLEHRFYDFFDQHLTLEKLRETSSYASHTSPGSITVPLVQWCSDYFIKGGQAAYFGPRLAEIDPTLTDAFLVFDELSYQVIYQYPTFLARKMQASRRRVLSGLKQYLQLPQDQRAEDAWFVKAMETEMRALNMSDDDMAIATMTIYWAINTNSRKAAFWLMAYLLQKPSLIDVVRQETEPLFRADGTFDFDRLHGAVPQLDAMWNEMLRLASFAASVRYITEDTVVGATRLRKGHRLIVPYRQLHMEEAIFGAPVNEFRHERFLESPRLAQGNSFHPFGGGATMCPGRHVAKRAVFIFVAMVLHRFDVKLAEGQQMLRPDLTKPVPGLMSPKEGDDMMVVLTPRKCTS
ncbi:cytochrome p450 [Apiospora arundinis]|uniref:Cytochrome P450 n=1 Tax=Apiospora arundinis TaxID=335852 RepID=A0ABR2JNS5_9PEZI